MTFSFADFSIGFGSSLLIVAIALVLLYFIWWKDKEAQKMTTDYVITEGCRKRAQFEDHKGQTDAEFVSKCVSEITDEKNTNPIEYWADVGVQSCLMGAKSLDDVKKCKSVDSINAATVQGYACENYANAKCTGSSDAACMKTAKAECLGELTVIDKVFSAAEKCEDSCKNSETKDCVVKCLAELNMKDSSKLQMPLEAMCGLFVDGSLMKECVTGLTHTANAKSTPPAPKQLDSVEIQTQACQNYANAVCTNNAAENCVENAKIECVNQTKGLHNAFTTMKSCENGCIGKGAKCLDDCLQKSGITAGSIKIPTEAVCGFLTDGQLINQCMKHTFPHHSQNSQHTAPSSQIKRMPAENAYTTYY